MDTTETYLPEGTVLKNRYRLISVLGTGGFGVTYRAVDQLLNRYVAVKGCAYPEALRHEAGILEAAKDVPYIARLRDSFAEDGTEYIVLNLIQGQSLTEYAAKRGGRLPAAEVLSLLQYTFDTLAQLHGMGIIHRDISPGNLMLSGDNVLYLIDFGSATAFGGQDALQNRQVFRHKGLEAPEHSQADRQGPWTDIFSLCATIVYLLTGEGIAEAADRLLFDSLPQLLMRSGLSSRQQNALLRGLNPEISRRFADVGELRGELYGETPTAERLPGERRVFCHAATFTGSRPVNQDNFLVDAVFYYKGEDCSQSGTLDCRPQEIHVAAVCDGVGGSSHGELAAKTAIQAILHFAEARHEREALPDRLLEELLDQVNEKVLQLGERIGRTATTLALFLWWGSRYYAVNIGDSPIYILRRGRLERLSTPHTKAALRIMLQKPVQKADYNTLTQYLGKSGVSGSQMAAWRYGKLQKGDTFLLCSDGVSRRLGERGIKRALSRGEGKAVPAMLKSIRKSETNDNCTAVVLKF